MPDPRNPFAYPLNPGFGTGIYRRRIRLVQEEGCVLGDLEDCNHGFSVRVYHDGQKVTAVEGQHHRIPYTTCGGAKERLLALQGLPVGLSAQELSMQVDARANCTHWLDLSLLAIRHISCNKTVRTYDVEVPDELDQPTLARVFCDGRLVHAWPVQDWVLHKPHPQAGNTLFKGFSAWANQAFADDDEKEAAFVLQKGYFVSRARRFDVESLAGEAANAHDMMAGACYTYSEPQSAIAVRTSQSVRDFSHSAEQLLQFK